MAGISRSKTRLRSKKSVRKKISGTTERPRLSVFRSSRHIYAQIIDDTTGKTLVAASSLSKELVSKTGKRGGNKEGAAYVGGTVADRALKLGIKAVIFDRNGFLYHGRVKALSEAARDHGLRF